LSVLYIISNFLLFVNKCTDIGFFSTKRQKNKIIQLVDFLRIRTKPNAKMLIQTEAKIYDVLIKNKPEYLNPERIPTLTRDPADKLRIN